MSSAVTSQTLSFPISKPKSASTGGIRWFRQAMNLFQAYVIEGFIAKRQIEKFYMVFGGHIFFQTMRVAVELDLFSKLKRNLA